MKRVYGDRPRETRHGFCRQVVTKPGLTEVIEVAIVVVIELVVVVMLFVLVEVSGGSRGWACEKTCKNTLILPFLEIPPPPPPWRSRGGGAIFKLSRAQKTN